MVLIVHVQRFAVVAQHGRAPTRRRQQGALHIALDASVGVGIAVEQKDIGIFDLRLLVFHIDLPGERLIAVFHTRGAFAHLDALHPRAGHVVQAEGLGEVAHRGDVFGQHLHVGAGQPEEFDLPGTGGGVTVVDIDRGVVDKTLAEVAAGGAQEFVAGDGLVVLRETEGVEEALALGGHGGGAQIHLLGGCRRLVGEGVGLLGGSGGLGHLGVQRRHGGDEEKREEERRRMLHCVSVDGSEWMPEGAPFVLMVQRYMLLLRMLLHDLRSFLHDVVGACRAPDFARLRAPGRLPHSASTTLIIYIER